MKKTNVLLLLTIFLCFTGCENKKSDTNPLLVENTTEVFTEKDKQLQEKKQKNSAHKTVTKATTGKERKTFTNTYTLSNIKNVTHKLTLSNDKLSFHDTQSPVVLLTLYSSVSDLYTSQISSLSKLQKKYRKKLFVASISSKKIDNASSKANYFISNHQNNEAIISQLYTVFNIETSKPSSLTIIYKDGDYYSHFEGTAPIEMLNHDVQKAIQN